MRAIRWSGEADHYLGPFTYARDRRGYRPLAVMFGSGDGDDYPGCRLRFSAFGHTLIVALPAIIKPWRRWVDTSHYEWSKGAGGYWDQHAREYGFSAAEGALHWHFGPQTHDSETTKSKCWFYPWRDQKCIRHSLYDLEGDHFATLPEWGFRHKNGWTVRNAIEDVCPVAKFDFLDFDGEKITAACKIEEREWERGRGIFRLFFLGRNRIRRSLDLHFSSEVGKRKGSWKGGTIGHSIDMLPGELHESAFRRYCDNEGLTFIGPAQGTSASGQDAQRLEGEAPQARSPEGDAP